MRISWKAIVFVAVLAVTVALDQGSKVWARTLPTQPADCTAAELAAHHCAGVPQPVVQGWWDWELAQNDGAAFSSFRGARVILTLLAFGALAMLGVMAARTAPEQRLKRVALAIIAGAAIGNLVDRLRVGAVTDFVRWHYGDHYWPVFNVADAALVIGVALLMLESVLVKRKAVTLAT